MAYVKISLDIFVKDNLLDIADILDGHEKETNNVKEGHVFKDIMEKDTSLVVKAIII